ncbi:Nif3-like dinuclear metal center hexameric protein [Roseivirga sp. E12]|uniref:Nif3-like dinuclear metal center hexameric protein n=1 Tax=Roseivirga sp. E12 TaxID=2819237 RepID=UPI001ABCDB6F|nr:Nif3-like dinuclear metal center hexameric protein [Roseivirga sp. E12]MBO3700488.1 Nif3-like dinuclear metal center hexameric protein [Roseivirga sp. E12]
MTKIKDIISVLENIAPRGYQENYDNSGLITGTFDSDISGVLITLDCIESVVDEAIRKKCNLIIAHHPIVFKGLKQLNGKNYVERTIIKAIKNDIAIYAIHTNLDNVHNGVNAKIAEKLELENVQILAPKADTLLKLEVFVPIDSTAKLLDAIHEAGAGNVGNYSHCSFKVTGTGSFRPNENAQPSIGQPGQQESAQEDKVELIFPAVLRHKVISAMNRAHPYEEVAHFIQSVENTNQQVGAGMIGELPSSKTPEDFLAYLKEKMSLKVIRYTPFDGSEIKKVALCGGAGSFLLGHAKAQSADAFVTGDFKYHEFFDGEGKTMIADIGHYESEVFTKELIDGFIRENFANIATYLSEVDTNPVKYF